LMLMASISMIKKRKDEGVTGAQGKFKFTLLPLEGFVVGSLTGLVGAGGGFLIIPSLVVLAKLPMHFAVGTSLLIIATNSLIGFLGDVSGTYSIDWIFLLTFSTFAIAGIFCGSYLANKISGHRLRPAFGWFVLVTGTFILAKEIIEGFN